MQSMGEGQASLNSKPAPSPPQAFFMFSRPLIPPGLRLGWLAFCLGPLSALGLRVSLVFFCWPLAMGCSDQRAICPSAGVGLKGGGFNVGGGQYDVFCGVLSNLSEKASKSVRSISMLWKSPCGHWTEGHRMCTRVGVCGKRSGKVRI